MFNTPYNRKIADEMHRLNKKFVSQAEQSGRMVSDKKMDSNIVPKPLMTSQAGAGIFSHLLSKIGLGEGESMDGGACGCTGVGVSGGRRRGRPSKKTKEGSGILSGLLSKVGLGEGEEMEAGRRKKRAPRRRIGKGDLEGSGIFSGLLSKIGLGEGEEMDQSTILDGGAMSAGKKRVHKKMKGKGLGQDIASGVLSTALHALTGFGEKKHRKPRMKAGAMSAGAMSAGVGYNMVRKMGEGKKKVVKRKTGKGLFDIMDGIGSLFGSQSTPLEQIAGPGLTKQFKDVGREMLGEHLGGKKSTKAKKTSPWIAHVKAYAKKHGIKYNEALKDPKCRMAYK